MVEHPEKKMSLKPNFLISDKKSEDTFVWQHCLITTKNWSQIVFKAPGTCRNRTHKLSIVILKNVSIHGSAKKWKSGATSRKKKSWDLEIILLPWLARCPRPANKRARGGANPGPVEFLLSWPIVELPLVLIEYNKQHPEKLKVWQKTYYTNIKADPVKYKAMLDKKWEQYKMKKSQNKALSDVHVELKQ